MKDECENTSGRTSVKRESKTGEEDECEKRKQEGRRRMKARRESEKEEEG